MMCILHIIHTLSARTFATFAQPSPPTAAWPWPASIRTNRHASRLMRCRRCALYRHLSDSFSRLGTMDDMVFCEALHDRDGHSTAPPTGAASKGGHAMKQRALELISTVLSTAQKAEIVGAKVQIDGTLTLDIEIDGEHALTLSIDEMRVVRADGLVRGGLAFLRDGAGRQGLLGMR